MKLKNLTPHTLHLHQQDGSVITLQPHGTPPRLAVNREHLGIVRGLQFVRSTMGAPVGLPSPVDGVTLVVSALVAEHLALAHRTDLAYPGEALRDSSGRVVGAKGLCAGPGMAAKMEDQQ